MMAIKYILFSVINLLNRQFSSICCHIGIYFGHIISIFIEYSIQVNLVQYLRQHTHFSHKLVWNNNKTSINNDNVIEIKTMMVKLVDMEIYVWLKTRVIGIESAPLRHENFEMRPNEWENSTKQMVKRKNTPEKI